MARALKFSACSLLFASQTHTLWLPFPSSPPIPLTWRDQCACTSSRFWHCWPVCLGSWSPCAGALGGPQAPRGSDGKCAGPPPEAGSAQSALVFVSGFPESFQGKSLHLEMSPSRLESLLAGLKVEQVPYSQVEIVGDKDRPQR